MKFGCTMRGFKLMFGRWPKLAELYLEATGEAMPVRAGADQDLTV